MVFSIAPFANDGFRFLLDSSVPSIIKLVNYQISGIGNASGLYDDEITQIQTGSTTMSGLVFPMRGKSGSNEALLLQQGILKEQDSLDYLTRPASGLFPA